MILKLNLKKTIEIDLKLSIDLLAVFTLHATHINSFCFDFYGIQAAAFSSKSHKKTESFRIQRRIAQGIGIIAKLLPINLPPWNIHLMHRRVV